MPAAGGYSKFLAAGPEEQSAISVAEPASGERRKRASQPARPRDVVWWAPRAPPNAPGLRTRGGGGCWVDPTRSFSLQRRRFVIPSPSVGRLNRHRGRMSMLTRRRLLQGAAFVAVGVGRTTELRRRRNRSDRLHPWRQRSAATWLTTIWRFESNGYPREKLFAISFTDPQARSDDTVPQANRSLNAGSASRTDRLYR